MQEDPFHRTRNRRHIDFDEEYDLSDTSSPKRSRWSQPWCFIQAADSQFGMINSYYYHRKEPAWDTEMELSEALVASINVMEPKPMFIIICGDLVDAWPKERETRSRQIIDFKRIFSKLQIPLVCVCGNHDIGNEPTNQSINEYRKDFGDDYFYFTTHDTLFIVINTQFYQHREYVQEYARDQDVWLEDILTKCKLFKYSFILEHIPWFLADPQEDDDYFNIKKQQRLSWLQKFKDAGVTKIFCGHYHRNSGGWFDDVEQVVTSAIGAQMGPDKSGARIVKMLDDKIEHRYFSIEELTNFKKEGGGQEWLKNGLA